MEDNQPKPTELRQFGIGFLVVLGIFASVLWWRGRLTAAAILGALSIVFGLLGVVAPRALGLVYGPWMKFAEKVAWFNTRLILLITFYAVITPLGLLMRMFGKDPMMRRPTPQSYWGKPAKHSYGNRHFERQF